MGRRRSRPRKRQHGGASGGAATKKKQPLVSWRQTMATVLDSLRAWSRTHYAPALDAHREAVWGDPPTTDREDDLQRADDDCICAPGSAGDGKSILQVFCDRVELLDAEQREQVLRWERERRRGVFLIQRAAADHLVLWDPLEGAPLTLHLLDKLGQAAVRRAPPGTVATISFQPWMALLVAVQEPEFFTDPRAIDLFRKECLANEAQWHDPPPPAPERGV